LGDVDCGQYKKGKKLLKEVKKALNRTRSSSTAASTPHTPDGNEADNEDGRNTHRSASYNTLHKIKPNLRQRSPRPRGDALRSPDNQASAIAPISSPNATSGSDDSTTPIVKLRGHKSTSSSFKENSQIHIRQVIDSLRRPTRKSTFESLEGSRTNTTEFDESELNFLNWLDGEVKKIDDFYQEKEKDAQERYKLLSAQLDVLRQVRESQRLAESNESSQGASRAELDNDRNTLQSAWVQKPLNRLRASLDGLSSAMPTADHERTARQPELMTHPIDPASGYTEYRVAKRRLKQAVLEFYRGMELLKGYRLLNRTGIAKILKKFDKTSGRKFTPEYTAKLKSFHFDQSEELERIMDHTEA
jgi:SPX domain